MHTYLIDKDEVAAYVRDLIQRLESLDAYPEVWCPVTKSGDAIFQVMRAEVSQHFPARVSTISVVPIEVSRDPSGTTAITFPESDPTAEFAGRCVLLIDGAIHSGETMRRCAAEILKSNPRELSSFSLVMKASTSFVPTFWGLGINETDRALFLLEAIPNHRLAGSKQHAVHLERLTREHVSMPKIDTGVPSMDRMTWSDRLFQMQAVEEQAPCTYLLRRAGTIVGYLTVHLTSEVLSIDEVAIDEGAQGFGYGSVLMRFADTLARQNACSAVRLNAIDNKVSFYEQYGYRKVDGRKPLVLDNETYHSMERPVLYHQTSRSWQNDRSGDGRPRGRGPMRLPR